MIDFFDETIHIASHIKNAKVLLKHTDISKSNEPNT